MADLGEVTGEEVLRTYRHPAARASFLDPSFERPPHVEAVSELLGDRILRGGARLIVVEPPRHGKTSLCSRWAPLWFLELKPHLRVLLTSYNDTFASGHGRWVRNRIEECDAAGMLPTGLRLSGDSRSVSQWDTSEGGGMTTAGIGGGLTGRGADLLIVDDPIKDSEEARSSTIKDKIWEWWQETALTRLEPGGSIVVIMTRWAEDDLVGRILEQDRVVGAWELVHLPAVAEEDDAIGRAPGEALWPERYPVGDLETIRREIGSHAWSSLYQGHPMPSGGGMFRKADFRYWSTRSDGCYVLHHDDGDEVVQPSACWRGQTVDTAMKASTQNDWTVVFTFAATRKRQLLVLEVERQRIEIPDQLPLIRSCRSRWNPRWTAVEDKGSGTGIIQEARRQGLALRPVKADADKVSRAAASAALYEQHAIFHPRGAPWLAAFEHELATFPAGAHDDQVDTLAHAVNMLAVPTAIRLPKVVRAREPTDMAIGDFRW